MKSTIVFIFIIFVSVVMFGQNFEGKIIYANSYRSNQPDLTDQQLTLLLGSTQEYLIKDGNYKSVPNGTLVQWQLYINKENKIYTKRTGSEAIFWNDAGIQGNEVLKAELNKNVTEVLGNKCDEVILTCQNGVQKYYFNSKLLPADARLFVNHRLGNWFDYLVKSNALPLKLIIETAQFSLECVATEVKPMKLDSKLFELPAEIKTEKSPY